MQSTIFLPVSSTSTLSSLTDDVYGAIKASTDPNAGETPPGAFPQGPEDIGLWRQTGEGEQLRWERVTDNGPAEKWTGLHEADTIGVSFKVNGDFPEPNITPPPLDDEEEQI